MANPKDSSKGGKPEAPPKRPAPIPVDPRPRAQVAYEGDDEFSVMSTQPNRRKPTVELDPNAAAESPAPATKPEEKNTAWHFIRKIFGQ